MVSPREAETRARDKSCHQPESLVPTVPEALPLLPIISQVPSIKHSSLVESGAGVSIACYPESPDRCKLPVDCHCYQEIKGVMKMGKFIEEWLREC